ncbi:hypothetical protein J1N35_014486 [Gossypium stocksii]|uniref:Uncharacterized protein n=1 Tax=Gossypium stocksii TaxID=47602 RepID=A0A9D4A8Z3_9ROSI|nr:hypothetical protein J1N35_014486 [Gossypium stocksii]
MNGALKVQRKVEVVGKSTINEVRNKSISRGSLLSLSSRPTPRLKLSLPLLWVSLPLHDVCLMSSRPNCPFLHRHLSLLNQANHLVLWVGHQVYSHGGTTLLEVSLLSP